MPPSTFAVALPGPALEPAVAAALATHPLGPFELLVPGDPARPDVVLHHAPGLPELLVLAQDVEIQRAAFDLPLVVLAPGLREAEALTLVQRGVQEVLASDEPAALGRALRMAIERKRLERAARMAYATDLATGLPHEAQLLEHMAQLLALREREPAPMVLLVLQIDGYGRVAAERGEETANVLRRKLAVRLRAALRASDVVASLAPDRFGVLLGHVEALADGGRVAAKLVRALAEPVNVAARPCLVEPRVGIALYPQHGKDAAALLQRALAQATSAGTRGVNTAFGELGAIGGTAANDAP